jgi:hypothetical protein
MECPSLWRLTTELPAFLRSTARRRIAAWDGAGIGNDRADEIGARSRLRDGCGASGYAEVREIEIRGEGGAMTRSLDACRAR